MLKSPARTMTSPLHPVSRAVLIASAANRAAPRAEFAFPPRSRTAAITGAPSGVEMVAASAFRCLPTGIEPVTSGSQSP